MSQREASERERQEHAWCLQLMQSQAFAFYLSIIADRLAIAHREVCAEASPSREFHAGRLSALSEAAHAVERRYNTLKPIVEVVP